MTHALHRYASLLFVLVWCACACRAKAQFQYHSGGEQAGMGYGQTFGRSTLALAQNPATALRDSGLSVAVGVCMPFAVSELSTSTAAIAYRNASGLTSCFRFRSQSFPSYLHQAATFTIGRKLQEHVRGGVSIGYAWQRTGEFWQTGVLATAAASVEISKSIQASLLFANPQAVSARQFAVLDVRPSFCAGGQYRASHEVLLAAELQKSWGQKMGLAIGCAYMPAKAYVVRVGYNTFASTFTFGMGIRMDGLLLLPALGLPNGLGASPHFDLQFAKYHADSDL